jgi:ribosomal protein S18 acetylase RimI-like enzyme
MPPHIRRAAAADASAILDQESLFPSDRMSARSVRRFLISPRARVLLAEDTPGLVLGNLVLLTRKDSCKARIYSVVVRPEARGRGIAAQLVRAAEQEAKQLGRTAVSLEVRADNGAARALYDKLGYIVERFLSAYYDDGADGLRLTRAL